MKTWKCLTLRKEGLPPNVLNEVVKCYPPFSEGSGFRHESRLEAQPCDTQTSSIIDQLLGILSKHGVPRFEGWAPGSYYFEAERVYEPQDLLEAELLLMVFHSNEIQFEHERDAAGRLILLPRKLKRDFVVGSIYPNHLVVSDKAMKLISAEQFDGIEFRSVASPAGGPIDPSQVIWEIWSSKVMPKMVITNQFRIDDRSGQLPFKDDYSKPIVILDPPYRCGGEVHYRRSDIESCEQFDVAMTFEKFKCDHQALVVSNRFHQFCEKNKIPLNVVPVRIDPD